MAQIRQTLIGSLLLADTLDIYSLEPKMVSLEITLLPLQCQLLNKLMEFTLGQMHLHHYATTLFLLKAKSVPLLLLPILLQQEILSLSL